MGVDTYFQMPDGVALPDQDFNVLNWLGAEEFLIGFQIKPGYTLGQILERAESENEFALSTFLEYEDHTQEGSTVLFAYAAYSTVDFSLYPEIEPTILRKREFACFRSGRYAKLIMSLTGIDVNAACSPEQVKRIAYMLRSTPYDPAWGSGVYTTGLSACETAALEAARTYGGLLGPSQDRMFVVREAEYAELTRMYTVFAELNASTYSA